MVNYKTIYTLPFKSRKGVDYLIDIQKENYDGESFELTGSGESPFSVEIESEDFLYTPIRFSTATIRVVGDDYLQQLYSTAYQQYRVTFKRNGVVAWCGFIKPEVYSQDYSSGCFELEIECASAMSVLEFVNYKQLNPDSKTFVSLWSLIKECISLSRGQYSDVYLPHVYAKDATDYANGANVLAEMTVSEQNFFDEDDKPMKLKEVLEEICKLLNWTCADYLGALYFVDIDYTGEYYRYTPGFESYTMEAIGGVQSVQRIGFSGAEHTLDFISGYNKATVKTSNYPIGDLLPDENFEELKVIRTIDDVKSDNTQVFRSEYLVPNNWETIIYDTQGNIIPSTELAKYANVIPALEGASLMRFCVYNQKDINGTWTPDITEYSFIDAIRVRYTESKNDQSPNGHVKAMQFKGATGTFSNGAIGISGSIKTLKAVDMIPWGDSETTTDFELACKIKIGSKYYGSRNGAEHPNRFAWSEDSAYFIRTLIDPDHVNRPRDWIGIENKKTLSMPYKGLSGMIIPINEPISGSLEFTLYAENKKKVGYYINEGLYLKDFKIVYQREDNAQKENDNSDRYYENVINEDYINELDEIEFKISSYNNDGACYSKVLLGNDYLTNNLYSAVMGKQIRPEEQLIHRIVNRYNATNIKLTQVIRESTDVTPITRLSDKYMGDKVFISTGGLIDYSMDSFQCVMIQI